MTMSTSVLVTGSSGMLGTALVERLLENGTDVVGIDRGPNRWSRDVDDVTRQVDLLDPDVSSELPAADVVVHLAANSRVKELVDEPVLARENVDTTSAVLEYARREGADLIFASSREVYGEQNQTVYGESDAPITAAANPYGASKTGCESLVLAYHRCYDVRSTVLRFSNVYGMYDVSDRVVPTFVALAARGKDLTVYGGDKLLDFLHIDDCVEAVVATLNRPQCVHGEVLNVGSGQGYAILELARMVANRVEHDIEVSIEPNRPGEVSRFVADVDRIKRLLGFETRYSLSEGLDRTVEWYRNRPDLLDEIA